MTLQTKLVISFTVLLLVVIATVGVVASQSIENILVGQTDRTLLSIGIRVPPPEPDFPAPDIREDGRTPGGPGTIDPTDSIDDRELFLRPFAEILIGPDGSVLRSEPSGFADEPDPLPDVSSIGGDTGLIFLDSVDGTLRYRANVVTLRDGLTVVYAAPLQEVATATASLIEALLLTGGGVLLLGAAATWWTVRRAIRPVDEMVDTAESIAAGDLTRRVPDLDGSTELVRLGTALNDMLTHIEHAVGAERAGRERLRRFVADASHELRTPITAISGYSELRRRGGLDSPEAEEKAWARIEAESKRMGNLVEELLTLARLGQGQPLAIGRVDLVQVARDAAADHAAIDPSRPVELVAPDTAEIEGDRDRLHQVISSLLANVRTHTAPGTRVALEVTSHPDHVDFRITDDGPGIPPDAIDKVFDRFYRADPSRSRRSGGSGLGLAIVQAIIEAHGGTVAASNVDGHGTRISLMLPRVHSAQPAPISG